MRNHSYENDFDLHENETACRAHFHKNGFALRLVLKQRHKRTRKWPIVFLSYFYGHMPRDLTTCKLSYCQQRKRSFHCFVSDCSEIVRFSSQPVKSVPDQHIKPVHANSSPSQPRPWGKKKHQTFISRIVMVTLRWLRSSEGAETGNWNVEDNPMLWMFSSEKS